MHITRRTILRSTALAGLAQLGSQFLRPLELFASSTTGGGYKALVCIALDGGCDGNNIAVPLAGAPYDNYKSARGPLALLPSSLLTCDDGLGHAFGVHNALSEFTKLYNSGSAAILANVGSLAA